MIILQDKYVDLKSLIANLKPIEFTYDKFIWDSWKNIREPLDYHSYTNTIDINYLSRLQEQLGGFRDIDYSLGIHAGRDIFLDSAVYAKSENLYAGHDINIYGFHTVNVEVARGWIARMTVEKTFTSPHKIDHLVKWKAENDIKLHSAIIEVGEALFLESGNTIQIKDSIINCPHIYVIGDCKEVDIQNSTLSTDIEFITIDRAKELYDCYYG